jgi:hypothetical protein
MPISPHTFGFSLMDQSRRDALSCHQSMLNHFFEETSGSCSEIGSDDMSSSFIIS